MTTTVTRQEAIRRLRAARSLVEDDGTRVHRKVDWEAISDSELEVDLMENDPDTREPVRIVDDAPLKLGQ
jgi:hypothetical protein